MLILIGFMATKKTEKFDQINKVLLIDLENHPNQIHQLIENLQQYTQVLICYAHSGVKVPIDWLVPIATHINNSKLRIIKMPNVGKNAADFGIAFWSGVLMAGQTKETHFDILSNDKDLDHVIDLLKDQGRSASRIGINKENNPTSSEIKEIITQKPNYLQEYCVHLFNHAKSRPAKKDTLLNNIKSKFNPIPVQPEQIFNDLCKNGVIVVNEANKIIYNANNIEKFAK